MHDKLFHLIAGVIFAVEAGRIKIFSVASLFLVFNMVALAKPNPVERLRVAFENADINIDTVGNKKIGSVGTMRGRNYFIAPVLSENHIRTYSRWSPPRIGIALKQSCWKEKGSNATQSKIDACSIK